LKRYNSMTQSSLHPIKVIDIELTQPIVTLENLADYQRVQALIRLQGVPLGYITAPIVNQCCDAKTLEQLILEYHSSKILQQLLANGLLANGNLASLSLNPDRHSITMRPLRPTERLFFTFTDEVTPQPAEPALKLKNHPHSLRLEDLWNLPVLRTDDTLPLVTVAVCTRDRPSDLVLCLESLLRLDYPNLDLLVVDNAPRDTATADLVAQYSTVRYVCEPRPGLDWARNRAIASARGDIIAYTDDDVIVDRQWARAIAQTFAENPAVMALTGLVVPYELETEAQALFELYGGFGRGFERKWYQANGQLPWTFLGSGQFGTGANMAYRRCVFDEIGYFDPALDVGTVTNGGGDLEMFFRVLKYGHPLLYEPSAIARHRHRRDYAKLQTQLTNNGIGLYSYLVRTWIHFPEEWRSIFLITLWWLIMWNLRRLWISFKHPRRFPMDLVWAEFWGSLKGLTRYSKAHREACELDPDLARQGQGQPKFAGFTSAIAIRKVDLAQPIVPIADVANYARTRVFITWGDRPLGKVDIPNLGQSISRSRLVDVMTRELKLKPFEQTYGLTGDRLYHQLMITLGQVLQGNPVPTSMVQPRSITLPLEVPVSIVVATYDRPTDLRNCLQSLVAQQTKRSVEIVVVDNHPASGLTPPIVAEFPSVMLVNEPRQGLAYARNTGFSACTGEIAIATDDDVTAPSDWLEKLVAPFAQSDVMVVTGQVFPIQLESDSQVAFENYGGLGRGYERCEFDGEWFESFPRMAVPTWELGATANAAFRTSIFNHPHIGLMDEALGPGMPSGVGEDTYLYYKVLKAGYKLIYDPSAYVWHKHRSEMAALRQQIYNYSKGHIAYHLTTWLRDRDYRGLYRIALMPAIHCHRIYYRLRGWTDYPIALVLLELQGNLAGFWSLWRSRQRVKREGFSARYQPQPRSVEVVVYAASVPTESVSGKHWRD
jgi:O-antigen biosynthesis protein